MSQSLSEIAVIGEQEQTFALGIEAADIKERRKFRWQQIIDRVGCFGIASRANETGRLIQHDINVPALMNEFAIDLDVIRYRRLEMKINARFSVHRYATGCD